jgi:hypothetical protein
MRSRRVLDPATARRMVEVREARRALRRAYADSHSHRVGGTPLDTSAAAQAAQDALLSRATPAEKLAMVAQLSRMVDQLSIEGLRHRHPGADGDMIRYLRAELRLGPEVAARVYGVPSGRA